MTGLRIIIGVSLLFIVDANQTKANICGVGGGSVGQIDEKTFDGLVKCPDYLSKPGTKVKKVSSLELGPYAVIRVSAI